MKFSRSMIALATGTLLLPLSMVAQQSQSQSSSSDTSMQSQSASSNSLNSSEQDFLKKASQGNQAEIELAQLAMKKSDNSQVKQLAQKIMNDHQNNEQQLQQLASKDNLNLPTNPDDQAAQEKSKLENLSGSQFDQQYVSYLVQEHQKDINEFQNQANQAQNSSVKNYAQNTLPKLQEHLNMAQQISQSSAQSSGSRY